MNLGNKKIALILPSLSGGGAERVVLNLAKGLLQYPVHCDIVVLEKRGEWKEACPALVRIVDLKKGRARWSLRALARYIHKEQPDVVISHITHVNLLCLLVCRLFPKAKVPTIVVEHLDTNCFAQKDKWWHLIRNPMIRFLRRWLYPSAGFIVAVSKGIGDGLRLEISVATEKIRVIANPVTETETPRPIEKAKPDLLGSAEAPPMFVSAGRLEKQKNFSCLIEAFALVLKQTDAQLFILGEGSQREALERQISKLGLSEKIHLCGFVPNIRDYFNRAKAFVLSSRYEGLPTVLIEAMDCGTQIVSADCPSGPAEILDGDKLGQLVPVGDVHALAVAMLSVDKRWVEPERLRSRAREFSIKIATEKYLKLIAELI